MRAFISYSLDDQEMFILSLLSSKLNEKGFRVTHSSDFSNDLSSKTKFDISKSDLFIGFITVNTNNKNRVLNEFSLANDNLKPSILLVEKGVRLDRKFSSKVIRFNRDDPSGAISILEQKIKTKKSISSEDSKKLLWIIGGVILIGLIGYFASKNED